MNLKELEELRLQQMAIGPDMTKVQRRKLTDAEVEQLFDREMRRSIRDLERDMRDHF